MDSRVATVGCPVDGKGGKLTIYFKRESARNSEVRPVYGSWGPFALSLSQLLL